MLTRYKGQLKLKYWAFAIAKRSTMRKARVALARRLAIIMHAMLRNEPSSHRLRRFRPITVRTGGRIELPQGATPEEGSRRRRGLCCSGKLLADCAFNRAALNPAYPIKRQPREPRKSIRLDPLECAAFPRKSSPVPNVRKASRPRRAGLRSRVARGFASSRGQSRQRRAMDRHRFQRLDCPHGCSATWLEWPLCLYHRRSEPREGPSGKDRAPGHDHGRHLGWPEGGRPRDDVRSVPASARIDRFDRSGKRNLVDV
jgi:hypothetical protein